MQGGAQYQRDGSRMANLAGLRVLVVEDHDEFQYFLAFMLRYFRAEVRGAASAEATGAVCAFKPDVIVVGIGLPGQDRVIHSIRAMPAEQGGNVPAVAVAPFGTSENHATALSLGFQTCVRLTAYPEELARAVDGIAWRTGKAAAA
jgi:CheY-like chemotaxis protein